MGGLGETPSLNLDEITRGLGPEERRCGSWEGVWCEVEPGIDGGETP